MTSVPGGLKGGGNQPVSHSLQVPLGGRFDAIRDAIDAIDRVHLDGQIPTISVHRGSSGLQNAGGMFDPGRGELYVYDQAGRHARVVAYHEIGHIIDVHGLPPFGTLASHVLPALDDWRNAVVDSEAIRTAASALNQPLHPVTRDALETYFLTPHEVWARSYAQYIATKSGDADSLGLLLAEQAQFAGGVVLNSHWDIVEFIPIMAEIDTLFASFGWIP